MLCGHRPGAYTTAASGAVPYQRELLSLPAVGGTFSSAEELLVGRDLDVWKDWRRVLHALQTTLQLLLPRVRSTFATRTAALPVLGRCSHSLCMTCFLVGWSVWARKWRRRWGLVASPRRKVVRDWFRYPPSQRSFWDDLGIVVY